MSAALEADERPQPILARLVGFWRGQERVAKVPEWVAAKELQAEGVRLFCLPHAGSGAAAFYRWKRLLPKWISVCPVMLPGREARFSEAALLTVSGMMDGLHATVGGLLDRPYAVFGHSMGGLLAYEWVRRIVADGLRAPEYLFVSGRNAPHLPVRPPELHRLGDAEFVEALRVRYGGVPQELLHDAELRGLFLPVLRADLTVVETYVHQASGVLACPIETFAGTDDRSVSEAGLAGWKELTTGSFGMRRLPGDHFYHLSAGQDELLAALTEKLASVRWSGFQQSR